MNSNKTASLLYFISGSLFALTALINFISIKTLMGVTYVGLSITFISLGYSYKKKDKN